MFIKVTKSCTRKYVQLLESHRGDDGKPRQRTVATLGRLDQMDRSLETMLQGLMRATGRGHPRKRQMPLSLNRRVPSVMCGH